MNKFSMWFANLMRGRYGMDHLGRFLLIVSLILIVADIFIRWRILDLLTVLILIYIYCRMFSRNFDARSRENQKFLQISAGVRGKFGKGSGGNRGGYGSGQSSYGSNYQNNNSGFRAAGDDTHRILRCPGCGEKLRVPKGAGTIVIGCPHCGTKFTKKV